MAHVETVEQKLIYRTFLDGDSPQQSVSLPEGNHETLINTYKTWINMEYSMVIHGT